MRLATIGGRAHLLTGTGSVDVERASGGRFGATTRDLLDDWAAFRTWADRHPTSAEGHDGPVIRPTATWDAPVPDPRQVFAIGLNYRSHVEEAGLRIPEQPAVFTKFPTSLTGPSARVVLPPGAVDWEVELVVIIGTRAEGVREGSAWEVVAGVMVGQDLSERMLQLAGDPPQFSLGKSYPGFAPTGPAMVTVDELEDPDDVEIGCALTAGELLQKGRTADLVFPVPELIARLSAVCPLLPGDLIFTGTPAGVGGTRTPPRFLAPGEELVSWADGVGEIRTQLVGADTSVSTSN